jgi:hypothetical protein
MRSREIVVLASVAGAFALGGCDRIAPDQPGSELNTSLLRLLRLVGVECTSVITSHALNEESTAWRITCAENRAYLASVESDGREICVTPIAYIEAPVNLSPVPSNPPQSLEETSRCAPYSAG